MNETTSGICTGADWVQAGYVIISLTSRRTVEETAGRRTRVGHQLNVVTLQDQLVFL